MKVSYFKIILLKELLSALCENKNSKKIIKSISSNENVKYIIVGNLEIQANKNSIPYFCFNDNTNTIKCHLLHFNVSWLSTILYSEHWTMIKYSNDNYYLESQSFSSLNDNTGIMQYYEKNYKDNFKLLQSKITTNEWEEHRHQNNQDKLLEEFRSKTFPLIQKSFISDKYTKYFQNGLTIIGTIESKSSLQLMKQDNGITLFFVIELKIKPLDNELQKNQSQNHINNKNNDITTTFIIFRMHEMNEILIYYRLLEVKNSFIFQNLFLHTIKLTNPLQAFTKNVFQFIHNKSHFEKLREPKSNTSEKDNPDATVIDLTIDSDAVESLEHDTQKGFYLIQFLIYLSFYLFIHLFKKNL